MDLSHLFYVAFFSDTHVMATTGHNAVDERSDKLVEQLPISMMYKILIEKRRSITDLTLKSKIFYIGNWKI